MNQQTFELPDNHSYFFPARGILALWESVFVISYLLYPFVLGEKVYHP